MSNGAEDRKNALYLYECPHAKFADDDPYLRANGCKQIACGRCVAEGFEKCRRDALEEAAQALDAIPAVSQNVELALHMARHAIRTLKYRTPASAEAREREGDR